LYSCNSRHSKAGAADDLLTAKHTKKYAEIAKQYPQKIRVKTFATMRTCPTQAGMSQMKFYSVSEPAMSLPNGGFNINSSVNSVVSVVIVNPLRRSLP
jgi:hypothetical protein